MHVDAHCQCGCGSQLFSSTMKVPGMNSGYCKQAPLLAEPALLESFQFTSLSNKNQSQDVKRQQAHWPELSRQVSQQWPSAALHSVRLHRIKQHQGLRKIPGSFNLSLQLCCPGWEGWLELTLRKAMQPPALPTKLLTLVILTQTPRDAFRICTCPFLGHSGLTRAETSSSLLYDGLTFRNSRLFFMT